MGISEEKFTRRGTKVVDSTWAFKKKSTGKLHRHLNACGLKQFEGVHCKGLQYALKQTLGQ
jgi:hypothetical protein